MIFFDPHFCLCKQFTHHFASLWNLYHIWISLIACISFNMDEHQFNWVTSVFFLSEKPRISCICSYSSVNRYESRFRFLQQKIVLFYNIFGFIMFCICIMYYIIIMYYIVTLNFRQYIHMTIMYSKVLIFIDFCDLWPHIFVVYFVYIIFLQYNVYICNRY